MKKTAKECMEALYNAGADAYLIEDMETAQWLSDYIDNHEVSEILPGDEDFEVICERLDLTPANNPKRVYRAANYNEEAIYFALSQDWDYE